MTETEKKADMLFGILKIMAKYKNTVFKPDPVLYEIYDYLKSGLGKYTVLTLDRKKLVELGYDVENIAEEKIRDMALDINLTQAFESEIGRLAGKYGLKKQSL